MPHVDFTIVTTVLLQFMILERVGNKTVKRGVEGAISVTKLAPGELIQLLFDPGGSIQCDRAVQTTNIS